MTYATPAGYSDGGREQDNNAKVLTPTLRHPDDIPEKRWCRFALVFCRCGIEQIESATMSVCARHFLEEVA